MTEHKDVCTEPGVQGSISNGKWTICKYLLILNKQFCFKLCLLKHLTLQDLCIHFVLPRRNILVQYHAQNKRTFHLNYKGVTWS